MKLVQGCLSAGMSNKAVLTTVKVLSSTYTPICVLGKIEKAVFTSLEVM